MRALATVPCLVAACCAWAQTFKPFVVKDIRVEGLQRTEPGTVFSYLPVKVGETMTEEKAQAALRALFATGFFKDVRLDVENDVLIVYVEERPAIAQVDFSGGKEFEPDNLRKVLREIGIAEGRVRLCQSWRPPSRSQRQYLSRGRYSAEVQTTMTPLERNRVGINFSVTEGDGRRSARSTSSACTLSGKDAARRNRSAQAGMADVVHEQDQYSRRSLGDPETLRSTT
jgi:outer membrane protein insertion porin family